MTVGTSAEQAWRRFETEVALAAPAAVPVTPGPAWRLVATFGIEATRARLLLGSLIAKGGLLQALGGGRLEGALWTDGKLLRLEAHVERTP